MESSEQKKDLCKGSKDLLLSLSRIYRDFLRACVHRYTSNRWKRSTSFQDLERFDSIFRTMRIISLQENEIR